MSEGETNRGFVPDIGVQVQAVIEGNSPKTQNGKKLQEDGNQDGGVNAYANPADRKGIKNSKWNVNFNRRQWTFLLIFGVTNIFRAVFILITPPFYPPKAKDRGITDSQIGFVFGCFDFSTFAVVLLFGKFIIPKFGPRLVFKFSSLNLAMCTVLFGCLDLTQDKMLFLTFSFIIRILAGAGDAGFYPSAFTIFAQEFEGNVSTAIGLFELLFGMGAIFGPIIFGSFIDYSGFFAVYAIVGFLLFCCVALNHFFVPPPITGNDSSTLELENSREIPPVTPAIASPTKYWYQLLLIPSILVLIFNLFTTSVSIGFIAASLETHLEQYKLSTFQTSVVFTVSNAIYTFSTPVWGKIADHLKAGWRIAIIFSGSGLVLIGFSFLGPLPFLANNSTLWCTLLGLGLHGLGIGGAVMSAFPHAADSAIADGFPETEETFSLVSSIYILTFTLGNSIGPAVSGVLVDNVGFQNATLFVVGLSLLVQISAIILVVFQQVKKKQK